MSSELNSLIVKNDLNLPKEQVDRLLGANARKGLIPLSPDKEAGLFLLYCCGDELDVIAAKTNLPRDVVLATAINYRWAEKAKHLGKDNTAVVPGDLQKELVNTLLVATFVSMQRELGEVIAGRRDASTCRLIPNSPAALEKFMAMVTAINAPKAASPQAATTTIHAQNVQVNNGLQAAPKQVESTEKAAVRELMLAELEKEA